jgi:hypothetical protein
MGTLHRRISISFTGSEKVTRVTGAASGDLIEKRGRITKDSEMEQGASVR